MCSEASWANDTDWGWDDGKESKSHLRDHAVSLVQSEGDVVVAQSLNRVQLFATPWTAALESPLSFTISQNLLKLTSIESVMPSNHLILCCLFSSCLQSFSASGSFPMSWLFTSIGQRIGASSLAKVLPMNIQDWFPSGLTGLILLSKGLSRVFSSTTIWKHQFFNAQPSLRSNCHLWTWILENP